VREAARDSDDGAHHLLHAALSGPPPAAAAAIEEPALPTDEAKRTARARLWRARNAAQR